jgi:hypothetical protein
VARVGRFRCHGFGWLGAVRRIGAHGGMRAKGDNAVGHAAGL